jgi:hypothetical protein
MRAPANENPTAAPRLKSIRHGLLAGAAISGLTAPLFCRDCGQPHTAGALTCPHCEAVLQRIA